jgi:CHAT domain-containing protein
MGNPALELGADARERTRERGLALGDLPEAEDEVRRLGRLYGPSRSAVYTGRQAREEVVKQELGRYQVAHLAAHAVLDDASPLYSHILLAQGGGPGGEDGLLEAWEVMKMDLAARLVVLSACQTARGRVGPGEGLVGMSWAFFIAGAPATVVSQWPVDSAATRELMVQFHKGLLEAGRSPAPTAKAEDLRRAALRVLRQPGSSHPFYWAPFVMVGDGGSP